jgi:small-conductance mechanosensitive channel
MYSENLLYDYLNLTYSGWGGLAWTVALRIVETIILIILALFVTIILQKILQYFVRKVFPRFLSVGSSAERVERTNDVVSSVIRLIHIFTWFVWVWFIILVSMYETGLLMSAIPFASWMVVLYKLCLVFLILIGIELGLTFINYTVDEWVDSAKDDDPARSDAERRARTISYLLKSGLRYFLYFIGFMMILREIGLDIGPALAGAGVLGLAIGFGAQTLVKDILAGFFILFEGQFHVGDYIQTDGVMGTVEKMTMRMTVVRTFDGALHLFPNSSLDKVSVLSKGFSRAIIDIEVANSENVDRMKSVLEEIVSGYKNPDLLESPVVMGLTKLGDSSVTFRIAARTKPLAHWSIERELRLLIKREFDTRGIDMPLQQRVVQGEPELKP